MASEIRVNKIINRSGLSTVTFTDDGAIVSGIVSATVYTGSGANLTNLPAGNLSGSLPAINAANLTNVPAANITGTLPAIDGSALTGVGVGTADSINTSGIITATAFVPTTQGSLSHRNIMVNGAMNVAQRGVSSTSTGFGCVDRFQVSYSGTDEAPTQAQASVASGTTPYSLGFRKLFKITNGNQTSGAGATDHIQTVYAIEDQDLSTSGWNYTSSSSYVTLSFYIKSSIAQNFYFYLQSDNGSQYRYVMETGSLSADTWTKVTKTISGNSNIVLNSDNGVGMYLVYSLFDGTDRTGTRPLNAWAALDNTSRTPDQTSTWYTTNDSTWEITGVQLEVGPVATPFEFRSFGDELARCQRYYQQLRLPEDYATGISNSYIYRSYYLPVTQRATGTGTVVSQCRYYSSSSGANFTPSDILPRIDTLTVRGGPLTNARGFIDGTIGLDAEL